MSTNQTNGWSLDLPVINPAAGLHPSAYRPTASDIAFNTALLAAAMQVVSLIASLQVSMGGKYSAAATRSAQVLLSNIQPFVTVADCAANGATFLYWSGVINWQTALAKMQAQISAGF